MRTILLLSLLLLGGACEPPSEGERAEQPTEDGGSGMKRYPAEEVPEALRPYFQRARDQFGQLASKLMGRLKAELQAGGPPQAIAACRELAPELTGEAMVEPGFELGRTSHKLRNPRNAPRPWVKPLVEEYAGRKASEARPYVFDLGDRVGVAVPIPTMQLCLQCHGPTEEIAPATLDRLAELYPTDRARGFSEGDLRGWFWAELEKE